MSYRGSVWSRVFCIGSSVSRVYSESEQEVLQHCLSKEGSFAAAGDPEADTRQNPTNKYALSQCNKLGESVACPPFSSRQQQLLWAIYNVITGYRNN